MGHGSRFARSLGAGIIVSAIGWLFVGGIGCGGDGAAQRGSLGGDPSSNSPVVATPEFQSPARAGSTAEGTPTAPGELDGGFELSWEDNFDAFDGSRWQLMTHSWDSNLAQFSAGNVSFDEGILSLSLTPEPTDAVKPFRGVEMRSIATERYGRIEARARLARGSGVVSSLVTIYTPWPADNWNELDIEFLGRYSDRVQFNAMVYTGPASQGPVQQSVTPTQFPELSNLDFDPSSDFHIYGIEWTPIDARFSIDGAVRHVWNTEIARLDLPMNILLTIWASSAASWAGALPVPPEPTTADYDWIRVYRWTGGAP
jgi:endo-1,3-1,4-beta-glycanase ExoK